MKAFSIERYGKHTGRITEAPAPVVGEHDVLVQIHASSINVLDAKIAKGEFKLILPYALPLTLGNDLAGVVLSVGSAVRASSRVTKSMPALPSSASVRSPS